MSASSMSFDGVIIGGGHNGLITAAYLAKAGIKVGVFESRPNVGGAFSTEELTVPGFKHNLHALYCKLHDSPVHGDLELDRYGVSYLFPTPKEAFIRHDSYFVYYQDVEATCNAIRRISVRDAETYARVARKWQRWYLDFLLPELYSPPKARDEWEAWIRKKAGGAEYLDVVLNYSPVAYAQELFESEYCRLSFVRGAVSAEYDSTTKGIPPLVLATIISWFAGTTAIVRGGTRRFAEAVGQFIERHGGKIFVGRPVEKIGIEAGAATGIVLQDGTRVRAGRFVASSIDPVHTFLFMVGEEKLPPEILERVSGYQFKETSLFRVELALKEKPIYRISERDPALNDALRCCIGFESTQDFIRMADQACAGRVPDILGITLGLATGHDPSQAPPGCHTACIGIIAPFDLADGGAAAWADRANETGDKMLDKLAEYAPNMTRDKILGRFNYTPKDIEAYLPDMINGDICQGKICPEQLGFNRPWPGMSDCRTFIDGLYLCGACVHPGGHATGAPGYNAANAIARDLGLVKWWRPFEPEKVVSF